MHLNSLIMTEKMAYFSKYCKLCLDEIEIGDTYYVFALDDKQFPYCEQCVEEERQI